MNKLEKAIEDMKKTEQQLYEKLGKLEIEKEHTEEEYFNFCDLLQEFKSGIFVPYWEERTFTPETKPNKHYPYAKQITNTLFSNFYNCSVMIGETPLNKSHKWCVWTWASDTYNKGHFLGDCSIEKKKMFHNHEEAKKFANEQINFINEKLNDHIEEIEDLLKNEGKKLNSIIENMEIKERQLCEKLSNLEEEVKKTKIEYHNFKGKLNSIKNGVFAPYWEKTEMTKNEFIKQNPYAKKIINTFFSNCYFCSVAICESALEKCDKWEVFVKVYNKYHFIDGDNIDIKQTFNNFEDAEKFANEQLKMINEKLDEYINEIKNLLQDDIEK